MRRQRTPADARSQTDGQGQTAPGPDAAHAEGAAEAEAATGRAAPTGPALPDACSCPTFAQAAIGMAHVGIDGRWLHVNQRLCDLLGSTRAELLRRRVVDLIAPADRARERARLRRMLRGETQSHATETHYVRPDHTALWLELTLSLVRAPSGAPQYAVAFLNDVTARTEAQRRLAEATRFLADSLDYEATLTHLVRAAVPALADWCCIVVAAPDGALRRLRVEHVDAARLALLHELERRYPLDPAAPDGEPQVLRTGQPELHTEVPDALLQATARDAAHLALLRQLGMASALIVPLLARGRTLGTLTFVSADAARRFGPADLTVAQDLAGRAALAVDNARLYREAREAVRVRDDFLLAASHDLRTPLTTIRGYADLLQQQLESGNLKSGTLEGSTAPVAVLRQRIELLRHAAARLAAAVEAITDVAQLHIGHALTLDVEPVALDTLVSEVAHRLAAAHGQGRTPADRAYDQGATRADGAVEMDVPAPDVVVPGDRVRLERVVQNIVGNALNYSPAGVPIRVAVRREDGWAVITVQDQGVGIPREELPRIFTRFYRASTSKGIKGSGIGLAGSKAIVEQHGGQIGIESALGAGTTVTVRLPVVVASAAPAASEEL